MLLSRETKVACALCGAAARTRLFDKDGYPIARCRSCGLVQVDVELGREELEKIYGEDYFTEEELLHDYVAEREIRLESGARVAHALTKVVPGGRLLDVGAAAGFFLEPASRHYDVTGVEISPFASEYARREFGLRVLPGDLTRPGGVLVMSTGDVSGPLARRDLEGWNLMLPPYHLYFFSPRTIDLLLAEAGFELRRIVYDGIVAERGRLRSRLAQRAATLLGTGNVMTVYATRADRPPRRLARLRRLAARYVPLAIALRTGR
jgi:hypothetical protein